jgi:hypothetical protein
MIDAKNLTKYEARIGTGGSSGGTTLGMQTMDIGYHIRGMQNCINCSNNTPTLNGGENDLFAQKTRLFVLFQPWNSFALLHYHEVPPLLLAGSSYPFQISLTAFFALT